MLSSSKVHALLSSLYKSASVMGPGQSVCYLYPQDLGTADSLYCCVTDEEWCVTGLAPPEVDDDLLGFVDGHVVFHLLSVSLSSQIGPTIVVSSADFTMWLSVVQAQQLRVIKVNSRGLRKKP